MTEFGPSSLSRYFSLTKPCSQCPFRSDIEPFLTKDRAAEICRSLERKSFNCHKTIDYSDEDIESDRREMGPDEIHCAGALILMEKADRRGDMQQIAQRLGLYDPSKLDMSAPVFETFEKMIEAQE